MIYQVTWQDIIRPDETWLFEDEAKDLVPAKIVTVGWLVYKDDNNLIIASSKGDGKQLGDINCIPLAVVLELKKLTN